jgi:nitrite reductase/ring-hydroxylating ferredoxin subunit/uncharacterized membrane protein
MRPFSDIDRLERLEALDRPAAAVRGVVQRVLSNNKAVKDALHGVWLGHPLHPALAQVALGSFLSASMIDLVGGGRRQSSGLIAAGLAATAPTVAAGWADWSDANPDQQRVGLVHAATNVAGVVAYAGVLGRRARGRSGLLLSLTGMTLLTVGSMLGGHLGYRQGLGANHADRVLPDLAPKDWTALARFDDVPDGRPVRLVAGDVPVFVLRRGAEVTVLANRCPHLAAPLHEGEVVGTDGDARIVCPWHGSEFRLCDGGIERGPATAPAPAFDSRVVAGELQARARRVPGLTT